MIRKLIGLFLVLIIFYLAIKALVFLPFFTNLIIGNNKSPFQIGTNYVNQINQIYPTDQYSSQSGYSNSGINSQYIGHVTLEKFNGKLILTVEGSNPGNKKLNLWLTNNSQITNDTEYVDFGSISNNPSMQQYTVDMKGGDISFAEYKYILLVDPSFNIYKTITLQ